jgi:hypothetical protein
MVHAKWWPLVALMVVPLAGQTGSTDTPITRLSLGQLQAIVQSMGFDCVRDNGNEFFTFQAQGYRVAVFTAKDESDFQLYAGFSDLHPTLETVNIWNRSHRFTRAYVDNTGDATLALDFDLEAGVTRKNIEATVRMFRDVVGAYVQACLEAQKANTASR